MSADSHNRNLYAHQGPGFILAERFGHEVMAAGTQFEPVKLSGRDEVVTFGVMNGLPGASTRPALSHISLQVAAHVKAIGREYAQPGGRIIRDQDIDESNLFRFNNGLGDIEFTVYFGAAVASSMVQQMVQRKVITPEAADAMSLLDWSDMIRSQWFRSTMHDLTQARPGQHVTHGERAADFVPSRGLGELWRLDKELRGSEFTFGTYLDDEGNSNVAAKLRPEVQDILAKRMQENGSAGCPVAHHKGTIQNELLQSPHGQYLLEEGHLVVGGLFEFRGKEYVRYEQQYTPIDRGLFTLASGLETYSNQFGRPSLVKSSIVHVPDVRSYPLRIDAPLPAA